MPTATTTPRRPRKSAARSAARRVVKPKDVKRPVKGLPHIDPMIDMSAADVFHKLPLAERRRRLKAFQAALGPALADYSSDDFRADQRREAERDG